MENLVKKELDGIIKKIDMNMKLFINATPNITPDLKYSHRLSDDGNWTGSFWMGMVMMASVLTDDKKYHDYINSFYDFYKNRLDFGYKDHDLGFLYQLYAVNGYRLTNELRYMEMAVKAAEALMYRYQTNGGYIRAWGRLISKDNVGKIIIDCLLNLPLLFCIGKVSGKQFMKDGAYNHALATLNNIRKDGSVYHVYQFDYVTGSPLRGENEGGYSHESCWSRGQSWGIYGFFLAYLHTQDKKFLEASVKLADYFILNLNEDKMPKWDFKLDEYAPGQEAIDTSAAAIAASALYDLCENVQTEKSNLYRKTADEILLTLINKHSHTFEESSQALLDSCYCGAFKDNKRKVLQWSSIFGDYFYMEALVKRSGYPIKMWSM